MVLIFVWVQISRPLINLCDECFDIFYESIDLFCFISGFGFDSKRIEENYLYLRLNYLNCYCFQYCLEWHSFHAVNVAVDGRHLDCTAYDGAMGGRHTVHLVLADHETCMDDSFHAVVGKMLPSSPTVSILD